MAEYFFQMKFFVFFPVANTLALYMTNIVEIVIFYIHYEPNIFYTRWMISNLNVYTHIGQHQNLQKIWDLEISPIRRFGVSAAVRQHKNITVATVTPWLFRVNRGL